MPCNKAGQNKVAVITGGGSGIGLAMARIFAANGYSVVITGRDAKRLQKAAANISPKNKRKLPAFRVMSAIRHQWRNYSRDRQTPPHYRCAYQ